MPKKSTGSRYPEEFKAEAVQLARSYPEKSIHQLSRNLGVTDQTLRNWVKQARIDRGERKGLTTEEREESGGFRRLKIPHDERYQVLTLIRTSILGLGPVAVKA